MFDNFWNIWSTASIGVVTLFLVLGGVWFVIHPKKLNWITPYHIWIAGIIISAAFMLGPIYYSNGEGMVLISLQHAIRLFAMDGGISDVLDMIKCRPLFTRVVYTVIGTLLYFFAAIFTFGFILSFFKNVIAYFRYGHSCKTHIHIFSELNERSLALANSIVSKSKAKNKKDQPQNRQKEGEEKKETPLIIFADIIDKSEEKHLDLVDGAEEIGAVFFRKDLASIKLGRKKKKHSIYLINNDESEKLRHAEKMINKFKGRENVHLYIFSDSVESKCFLESYDKEERNGIKMKVERINDIRFLIYHDLNQNGIRLFENALTGKNGQREISAVVIGLGRYGMEMVKALMWYCQLPGYKINITVFDEDRKAKQRFCAQCPGIRVGTDVGDDNEDMKYRINIRNVKAGTVAFQNMLSEVTPQPTFVFVCLGSDSENLSVCIDIRRILQRKGIAPDIETVIYNSALKNRIGYEFANSAKPNGSDAEKAEDRAAAKQSEMKLNYKIHCIGDLEDFYSVGTVIESNTSNDGLCVHERWGSDKNGYYMNDYNAYSSMANALHRNLRKSIFSSENLTAFPFLEEGQTNGEYIKAYGFSHSALMGIANSINENQSLNRLADDMKRIALWINSRTAYYHYMNIKDPKERLKILQMLDEHLKEKAQKDKRSYKLPMLADTDRYEKGYYEFFNMLTPWTYEEAYMLETMLKCIATVTNTDPIKLEYTSIPEGKDKDEIKKYIYDQFFKYRRLFNGALYYHCSKLIRSPKNKKRDIGDIFGSSELKAHPLFKDLEKILKLPENEENFKKFFEFLQPQIGDRSDLINLLADALVSAMGKDNKKISMQGLINEFFKDDDSIVKKLVLSEIKKAESTFEADRIKELDAYLKEYYDKLRCFAILEHIRWNAYMRMEGFLFGPKLIDHRTHCNLIPVGKLTLSDCVKDI